MNSIQSYNIYYNMMTSEYISFTNEIMFNAAGDLLPQFPEAICSQTFLVLHRVCRFVGKGIRNCVNHCTENNKPTRASSRTFCKRLCTKAGAK